MSFLFPAVLWGLIAVSLPIIIHLISLRHTKTVDFSTIRHIKALEHETIRKLKIRQWILILLRMGIISALVLMVSGPILMNESLWIPSENESTAVIIIDNSASMAVTNDRHTYLDKVKAELPNIVSGFNGLVNLHVYQTTPVKQLYDGIIKRGMSINPAIWNISQAVGRDKIWSVVDSVLKSVTDASGNRECYILSDFPVAPPSNFKTDFNGWQFYFFGQEPMADNVSISHISTVSQIKLPNHLLKLNTKIENMKLVIPRDDYYFDDTQTFELTIPEQISCKVIANSQDDLFMLKTVLESISGKDRFLDIELKVMDGIHRVYLDETDVLILQDPKHLSPSAIESMKRFLSEGGSILWFSGENYAGLSSITQANLKLPKFIETVHVTGESYFSVDVTDRDNPILQELNLRDLSSALPQIYKYNKIENQIGHKNILTLNNDDSFFLEIPHSGSQIYYFTSPLDLRWNDFGMKGLLIPLIHRLLILSATNEINTSMVEVGQEKYIKINKALINKKWSLITPSGNRILLVPDYNREELIINNIQELGSYEVFAADEFYTAFSSKLSPFEKPSLRAREDQVISILGESRSVWIHPGSDVKGIISSHRQGKALWRTFLILAIAFLMLESYLSRMRTEEIKVHS